jgi:molybdopterin converting factor small subunit
MKVKVYAPAFCSFKHIDEDGNMVLPDGASLNDVYKKLRVPLPFRKLLFSAVNYRRVKLNTQLKDGDVVSFLAPLSGG